MKTRRNVGRWIVAGLVGAALFGSAAKAKPKEEARWYTPFPKIGKSVPKASTFPRSLGILCESWSTIAGATVKAGAGNRDLTTTGATSLVAVAPTATTTAADLADALIESGRLCEQLVSPTLADFVAGVDAARQLSLQPRQLEKLANLSAGVAAKVLEARTAGTTADLATVLATPAGTPSSPTGVASATLLPISDRVIAALAEVIVKRAKAEALLYLREKLVSRVCVQPVRPFVENTCGVLEQLDAELSLQAMGAQLHAAAVADLQQLPDVVFAYAAYSAPAIRRPEVEVISTLARLAWQSHREIHGGRDPMEVLGGLHLLGPASAVGCTVTSCQTAWAVVRTGSAFVEAIRRQPQWQTELGQLTPAAIPARAIATILLAEESLKCAVLPGNGVTSCSAGSATPGLYLANVASAEEARAIVAIAWVGALAIREKIDGMDEKVGASSEKRRREMAIVVADSVELAASIGQRLVMISDPPCATTPCKAMAAVDEIADITRHAAESDYGALVLAIKQFHYDHFAARTSSGSKSLATVMNAMPLLVEIATAKSSTEIAATLDAAIAPVGSYRAKYQRSTITLNAFLGAMAGGEYARGEADAQSENAIAAAFAPVGLHMTAPFAGREKKWMHVGALLSVVDLGALTTVRIKEEATGSDATTGEGDVEKEPKIGFLQVLSPGAYVTLGIARSPVVIGAGASYVPRLREVEAADGTLEAMGAIRFGAFVAIDIVLWGFGR